MANRIMDNRTTENRITDNGIMENRITDNRITGSRITDNGITGSRITNNRFGKRTIILVMVLVALFLMAFPIRSLAYDPINMDLNDPADPIRDNCWLPRGQLEYVLDSMRPIIVGTEKYVYTDKSYGEDYLIKENVYFIGEENVVTLYVKFVQTLWNGDTQSKYYYVVVYGPPTSYYTYMESLLGRSTHPIEGNEGTLADPYAATITVPYSVDEVTLKDIKKTPDDGSGYELMFPTGDYDVSNLIDRASLYVGENHVYIVILNIPSSLLSVYDITVVREPEFVLESIAITTPPTKVSYIIGEPLDLTGLTVTGTYSNGTTALESVTMDNVSGFYSLAAIPALPVTVTINGKTATFMVEIKEAAITNISIDERVIIEVVSVPDASDLEFNPKFKITAVSNISLALYVAMYDSDGRLFAVNTMSADLNAGSTAELQASLPYEDKDYTCKFFIWDAQFAPLTAITKISDL